MCFFPCVFSFYIITLFFCFPPSRFIYYIIAIWSIVPSPKIPAPPSPPSPSPPPTSVNACYAVQVEGILDGTSFLSGETIEQTITIDSVDRIAKGTVISYDTTNGVIPYSQNSSNTDVDGNLYRFAGTNTIKGVTSQLGATPTTFGGTLTGIPFVNGYSVPQITAYSGMMTYLANVSPVVRDPLQTERISLLISF